MLYPFQSLSLKKILKNSQIFKKYFSKKISQIKESHCALENGTSIIEIMVLLVVLHTSNLGNI